MTQKNKSFPFMQILKEYLYTFRCTGDINKSHLECFSRFLFVCFFHTHASVEITHMVMDFSSLSLNLLSDYLAFFSFRCR